jgi:hypothetical protein
MLDMDDEMEEYCQSSYEPQKETLQDREEIRSVEQRSAAEMYLDGVTGLRKVEVDDLDEEEFPDREYDPLPTTDDLPFRSAILPELEVYSLVSLSHIPRQERFKDHDHGITFTVVRNQEPFSNAAVRHIRNHPDKVWLKLFFSGKEFFVGTFSEAVNFHGWSWCCSRQRPLLQTDLLYATIQIIDKVPVCFPIRDEKKRVSLYFEAKGPRIEDVLVEEGLGGEILSVIDGVEYLVSNRTTGVRAVASVALKYLWLEKTYPPQNVKYSDQSTYEKNMDVYSLATFSTHQAQVRDFLALVDDSVTIVAPADGVGVVARSWKGKKICGDINRSPMTSESVRQESIKGTMNRAKQVIGAVLYLFSYCDDLFSQKEWDDLLRNQNPMVFFTANRLIESRIQVERCSPGVYVRNFSCRWRSVNKDIRERGDSILFSENFLQIKPIFEEAGPYYDYYTRMNPLGSYSVSDKLLASGLSCTGEGEVLVAETIQSWFRLKDRGPTYLVLLGKIVAKVELLPRLGLSGTIQSRVLYEVLDPKEAFEKCPSSQLYAGPKHLYFCTWSGNIDFTSRFSVSQIVKSKRKEKSQKVEYNLSVRVTQGREVSESILMRFKGLEVEVMSPMGDMSFPLRQARDISSVKSLIKQYSRGDQEYVLTSLSDYMDSPLSFLETVDCDVPLKRLICLAKKTKRKTIRELVDMLPEV